MAAEQEKPYVIWLIEIVLGAKDALIAELENRIAVLEDENERLNVWYHDSITACGDPNCVVCAYYREAVGLDLNEQTMEEPK